MPHRGYLTRRGPSYGSSERSRRSTVLRARGLGPLSLALRDGVRRVNSNAAAQSVPAAMLNWTSFRAFERGYAAEAPIRVIPRIGSAYKPKGYSSHPPNPLSILLVFCRDNHYRCPLLNESRTTTAARTTKNFGACPIVPPSSCSYQQGELTPYLVSHMLLVELDFRTTGYLSATNKYQARRTPVESTCPVVPIQYSARAPLDHPTPYL